MTSSRVHVAERALRKGDLAGAITAMEAALNKAPDDVKARRQLADTYAKAGRFADAVRELTTLAEAFAAEGLLLKASSAYKAILDIDPDHDDAQQKLASLQANKSSALADAARQAEGAPSGQAPPRLPDDTTLDADELVEAEDVLEADDVAEEIERSHEDEPPVAALEDATLEVEPAALGMEDATLEVAAPAARDLEDATIEVQNPEAAAAEAFEADAEAVDDAEELELEDADDLIVAELTSQGDDDVELDRAVLPELPLFSDLPQHAFDELISDLDQWRVPSGAVIVRQGEVGHSFFVVVSGEARVERDGDELATLGRGELFGEMALLSRNPRAASVVAASACELFEIKRERIDDLMTRYPSVERVLQKFCRQRLLSNVLRASLFEGLDETLAREMIGAFKDKRVSMGQRVVSQGDKGRGLFVVLAGTLDVSREDEGAVRTVSQLAEGDVFGEMSLIFGEPASASVMALSNTTLLTLSQKGFQAFCKRHPVMKRRLEALARGRRDGNANAKSGDAAE